MPNYRLDPADGTKAQQHRARIERLANLMETDPNARQAVNQSRQYLEENNQIDGQEPSTNQTQQIHEQHKSSPNGSFHNPYTFVPTPPREEAIKQGGFAGDFNPLKHPCGPAHNLDHASLKDNLWTGHVPIKLKTVTPLVLPDAGGEDRLSDTHQTYDVHDRIPEPSLRGMLRSAYEVVTNSRYGCFGHDKPLKKNNKAHKKSPLELLDLSLHPASSLDTLSPADRLFGWVISPLSNSEKEGDEISNYKGRIRVVCEDRARPEIIQHFKDGSGNNKHLPLTILSAPKPTYGRFYVAEDNNGTPQKDGCLSKEEAGYSAGKGLRGRKQYWHHRNLEVEQAPDYWKPLIDKQTQEPNQEGLYQEYFFRDEDGEPQKHHQNRSIRGWIKPGTKFRASLYVQNLETEEVGALIWLLTFSDKHFFKLGYGKPLGFGSVRMKIDKSQYANGCLPLGRQKDWKEYYASLDGMPPATVNESYCIRKFKKRMVAAYPASPEDEINVEDLNDKQLEDHFKELPFIKGFLQVLRGPETEAPIHYPRKQGKPSSEAKSLEWFKTNDSEKKGEEGGKLSLPDVTGEKTLPYNLTKE